MRSTLTKPLLGLAFASLAIAPVYAQQVRIDQGVLQGASDGPSMAFKGIPYAAKPIGPNRWRAPQPAPRWTGVKAATAYGPDCSQAPFPPDAAPIRTTPQEDCLYANVWQPKGTKPSAKLPVMVWIYGGGFVNGGTSPAVYSGKNFARDGIVFVSFNYRLGRFGFFAHPGLEKEGFGGNFGFLDQIAALKWVQRNIAAFGGDPNNVTVFGESAGGMSVNTLLQSPLARGLFDKAIIESGGGRDRVVPIPTMAQGAKAGDRFAPGDNAAQLRAISAKRITGDLSLSKMDQPDYSGPMIDGRTVLGQSVDSAEAGLYARVPVMIGTNSADGFPGTDDKTKVFNGFGPDKAEAMKLYDPNGTKPGFQVATDASADAAMIEPARAIARALAPHQSVYLYRFAYQMPGDWAKRVGGAPHASEIPYVFDTVAARAVPMIPAEAPVATLTHRYWVNFAKCGSPDCGGGVPAWPKANATDTSVQMIDAKGARHETDPLTARLDFAEKRATQ
ncbi:MAG: carboxylesterase family protein [Sphingomonadaceae bacterium]